MKSIMWWLCMIIAVFVVLFIIYNPYWEASMAENKELCTAFCDMKGYKYEGTNPSGWCWCKDCWNYSARSYCEITRYNVEIELEGYR